MKKCYSLTTAHLPLLLIAALAACDRSPDSPPEKFADPKVEYDAGPLVSDQLVRGYTIHGVRLGMDLNDAADRLRAYSALEEKQYNPRDAKRPWVRRVIATNFTAVTAETGDLAQSVVGGQPHAHVVELYATPLGGRDIVTGISFRFHGKLSAMPEFDQPTTRFSEMIGGSLMTADVYAGEHGLTSKRYLDFLDGCNAKDPGSIGDSWNCDLRGLPKQAFLYISHYSSDVGFVVIRDAAAGRAYINSVRAK